jgi:hypothetical protein
MSAFEFFFSFYGLVLGLSVAVIATGASRAFKHRNTVPVGWLTPLLAVFVALDIATFWDSAWTNFRHLPFSYGLLVAGLAIAAVYFVAASLIFPDETDRPETLNDHFWANKRAVLILLIVANLLGLAGALGANWTRENGMALMMGYGLNVAVYLLLVGLAAWTRRGWLFGASIGLHTVLYLVIAVLTALNPSAVVTEDGDIIVHEAPAN